MLVLAPMLESAPAPASAAKSLLFWSRRWRQVQHFGYFGADAGVGSNKLLLGSDP